MTKLSDLDPDRIPFRLRVLRNLTEALETITPANGYTFDLTGRVHRGILVFGEDTKPPMVTILEAPIPADVLQSGGPNPNSTGPWEVLVQGFVKDDPAHPSDMAHILMAEVKAALVKEKRRERGRDILGMRGRVTEMYLGQGSVRPEDGTSTTFFWLTLTLRLVENLEDPYF